MACLPKKTYSRRNHELSVVTETEKENVDPFDELLSSPLKQEVQFQPLSFWGNKVRHFDSKGKTKKANCGLFEESDSDEINSPSQRKRKPKTKHAQSRARTLQLKNKSHMLSKRTKSCSTAYSFFKKTKDHEPNSRNQSKTLTSTEEHKNILKKDTPEFSGRESHIQKPMSVIKSYENTNSSFYLDKNVTINLNDNLYEYNFNKLGTKSFKIYKDNTVDIDSTLEEKGDGVGDAAVILTRRKESVDNTNYFNNSLIKTVILNSKEDSVNCTNSLDESTLDKTFITFQSGVDSFVNKRRYFNCLNYTSVYDENKSSSLNSITFGETDRGPSQLWKDRSTISSVLHSSGFEDVTISEKFSREANDESLVYFDSTLDETKFQCNESRDRTFSSEISIPFEDGDSVVEFEGENTVLCLNETELADLFLELQNANLVDNVSLTSDDTLSSFTDEATVIKVGLNPNANVSSLSGSDVKDGINEVSSLTTGISDLSISNAIAEKEGEPEVGNLNSFQCESKYEDKEKKDSFSTGLVNVTTKRGVKNGFGEDTRYRLSSITPKRTEKENEEMEFDQSLWLPPGRKSFDWNKTISFADPVFESTRMFDTDPADEKRPTSRLDSTDCLQEETLPEFDGTIALKPGKKWFRSMSVLKQLQNGGGRLESTRITGRKFDSFVQDMLEVHNERPSFFSVLTDASVPNKTLPRGSVKSAHFRNSYRPSTVTEWEKSSDDSSGIKSNVDDSVFSKSLSNNTCLEKTSLNRTVKVIEPEEKPSAFRSALGVQVSHSSTQNSVEEESSAISARDFILMQCGQKDVVSFEEHFNEKTLKNCRKIGEGVYGEVFLCSDAVIKIIPIEGSDKVNGEPQKTFEEIISEVVIAAKLSNLRKGKKHRTDGFSEMKRCWCVKGKYPKYLLQLWDEYDQSGSGSENDSPVMFKEEQLYIILELANGGKDLESFVFSSSAQSLSVFVQTAYSLAAAEKAFEFEHRDLHWGNVLISETKEKFTSVFLDGVEYKIPTKGVKVCIIDFTLSRINHEGCCIFNDLSVDPSLFASEGDYQFEIYRMMLREVMNDWSLFRPKTNIFWLHYTVDKLIKMVRYKNKKTKVHSKYLKELKCLESVVLRHKDSADFVLSEVLNDIINKL